MAIKKTIWNTAKYIPIAPGCCDEIVLCIDPNCKYITANSSGILYATVQNKGRFIGDSKSPQFDKHRCNDLYQYELAYDDTQMALNQVTGLPYELKCPCIMEVFPYTCIYNYLSTLGDWVVDRNNVTVVDNEEAGTFTVTIPIIDRINGTSIGSFSLDMSSLFDNTYGTFSAFDTPTGGWTFTDGAGVETIIQIVSQDIGNLATVGSDNGVFINSLAIGTDELSDFDTPTGGYTHTALDGTAKPIQIISQDAGNNASAGTDNGVFVDTDDLSDFGTPAGGYTHTALDGTAKPIQVLSQDAGNLTEAGSDNGTYTGLSTDAGNNLFIGTDNRIYSPAGDTDGVADSGPVAVDISGVGTYTIATGSLLTLNNPSTTRAQNVLTVGDNTLQMTLLAGGKVKFIVQESEDGGAYASIAESDWGEYGTDVKIPMLSPVFELYTIPAGGSKTLQRRLVIQTLIGTGATSSITAYAIGIRDIRIGI